MCVFFTEWVAVVRTPIISDAAVSTLVTGALRVVGEAMSAACLRAEAVVDAHTSKARRIRTTITVRRRRRIIKCAIVQGIAHPIAIIVTGGVEVATRGIFPIASGVGALLVFDIAGRTTGGSGAGVAKRALSKILTIVPVSIVAATVTRSLIFPRFTHFAPKGSQWRILLTNRPIETSSFDRRDTEECQDDK